MKQISGPRKFLWVWGLPFGIVEIWWVSILKGTPSKCTLSIGTFCLQEKNPIGCAQDTGKPPAFGSGFAHVRIFRNFFTTAQSAVHTFAEIRVVIPKMYYKRPVIGVPPFGILDIW